MPTSRVGIVVVNWNGAARSAACLRSLLVLDTPLDTTIVLVDNGSTDGSARQLEREFPDVDVLAQPANGGYAKACNAGIELLRRRGADHVWLLNNDTTVAPDALNALAEAAREHCRPALFCPKTLSRHAGGAEYVWSAGGTLRWPWLERGMRGQDAPPDAYDEPCEVMWASGCSLFFPMRVFDVTGPMDERYFMYLEDVDWCLTARRLGIPVVYVPAARIWHSVSSSVRELDPRIGRYYDCRNYFLFVFRHGGIAGRAWASLRFGVTAAKIGLRLGVSSAHRRDSYYNAQTRALWDVLRRRWGQAPYDDAPLPASHAARREVAVG